VAPNFFLISSSSFSFSSLLFSYSPLLFISPLFSFLFFSSFFLFTFAMSHLRIFSFYDITYHALLFSFSSLFHLLLFSFGAIKGIVSLLYHTQKLSFLHYDKLFFLRNKGNIFPSLLNLKNIFPLLFHALLFSFGTIKGIFSLLYLT
jgi:hypothetical protein